MILRRAEPVFKHVARDLLRQAGESVVQDADCLVDLAGCDRERWSEPEHVAVQPALADQESTPARFLEHVIGPDGHQLVALQHARDLTTDLVKQSQLMQGLAKYCGVRDPDEEPVDPKAGHIPGAISLPQEGNLTADLAFLPPETLHSRFSDAGILTSEDVIVHCGSGVTACHNILAMEVAGFRRPALYVGSWSDWSSRGLPVATGAAP